MRTFTEGPFTSREEAVSAAAEIRKEYPPQGYGTAIHIFQEGLFYYMTATVYSCD